MGKPGKKEPDQIPVRVKVNVYPKNTMFLRVNVGDADDGKSKYELTVNASDSAPIITSKQGDEKIALFPWQEMINAAREAGIDDKKFKPTTTSEFTEEDLVTFLEMASIAMGRDDVIDQIADEMDLSDEEIERLNEILNKFLIPTKTGR